ncbi:FecR domain-containing protein [Flammeovirga kamogawensis]|uniref:DUF4974 domain-containing protein n=1 Tax=Flammeovirga kamogawensis TaxID=373891 RepID=A0ABX8GSI2_9BACT|nr:FecR domain-containing protein [Flammeovirga kamogawensis]MBB6461457.1 hypothetical protein [Flammeovirga kamogawensis]QWG06351.1 DUF4974 domain-containing protein [Flammeovirga kamogawensis]TRX68179.1 DUF4974 domain-containing protein [Flammeovirga kamogawensis]
MTGEEHDDFVKKGIRKFSDGSKVSEEKNSDPDEILLNKISTTLNQKSIPNSNISSNQAWDSIQKSITDNKEEKSRVLTFFQKKHINIAAAVLGVFVGLYALYFFSNGIHSINPSDGTLEYTFPDGSVAFLKKGSNIKYLSIPFDGQIYLDGHAQFNISPLEDGGKVFEIKTKRSVIKAHPSSNFDIRDDNFIYQLTNIGSKDINYRSSKDEPNLFKTLNQKDMISSFGTNLPQPITSHLHHTLWTKGVFKYELANVEMVFSDFEKQYGVTINHSIDFTGKEFTGVFRDDNVNSAMKEICNYLKLDFVLAGEKVILSEMK